eukprot:gb/GECG01003873.1/.p1 GENE.gb/GECG01003873.1/~~gb/GECG01003873.1/.p1  ORF type:complete len:330 (+),score=33.69 gb/GECG01003873.1/:1-990(+)
MEDEDGFTLVVRKHRRNRRHKKTTAGAHAQDERHKRDNRSRRKPSQSENEGNETIGDEEVEPGIFLKNTLNPLRERIRDRSIYKNTVQCCKTFLERMPSSHQNVHFVALGIGNFTESHAARLQLAMLLELMESLQSVDGDLLGTDTGVSLRSAGCTCVDPMFSNGEVAILRELRLQTCYSEDEVQYSSQSSSTILFMPHCPGFLYGRVIEALVTEYAQCKDFSSISPFMILGNSLLRYLQSDTYIPRHRLPSGNQELFVTAERLGLSKESCVHSLDQLIVNASSSAKQEGALPYTCERLSEESTEAVAFKNFYCHRFMALGQVRRSTGE